MIISAPVLVLTVIELIFLIVAGMGLRLDTGGVNSETNSSQRCPVKDKKQWAQTDTQKIPFELKTPCFVVRIAKHDVQRCC